MTKFATLVNPVTERRGRIINGGSKDYADYLARVAINELDAEKQAAITDGAAIGLGLAVCSTAPATAAKTATLANYIKLKNMPVSVRFTTSVNVANATLNINSTGAHALMIGGAALQPGVINAGMTATVVFDGTNWNIIGLQGLEESNANSDLLVDLALPSGLKWARRNIDITQANGFAASEFQYECSFFSWGNTEGHNPTSTSAFGYDWGSGNDGPYASTPGAAITGQLAPSQDAARANAGAPWRQPLTSEFQELFDNCEFIDANGTAISTSTTNKLVTVNSITGIYLKSKNNSKRIFFPCSGYGDGASWHYRGSRGLYWSASLLSASYGRILNFHSGGVFPQHDYYRFFGFAVRPVQ